MPKPTGRRNERENETVYGAVSLSPQPFPDATVSARVLDFYRSGKGLATVTGETGVRPHHVYTIVRRAGLLRPRGPPSIGMVSHPPVVDGPDAGDLPLGSDRRITPDGRRVAVEMYLGGGSTHEIADVLGVDSPAIRASVNRAGFDVRDASDTSTKIRRYSVNEEFFNEVDAEAKAYVLGFVTTDGHVAKTGVEFNLSAVDFAHLEKIRDAMGSDIPVERYMSTAHDLTMNGKIAHVRSTEIARLRLHSTALASRLREMGFESNKLLRAVVCPGVPPELARHYWRGVVDGDGSISCHVGIDPKGWVLGLVGSEAICAGFLAFVQGQGVTTGTVVRRKSQDDRPIGLHTVVFGGNVLAPRVLSLLYGGSRIHLDRKKALAEKAIRGFEAKYGPMDAYDFGPAPPNPFPRTKATNSTYTRSSVALTLTKHHGTN